MINNNEFNIKNYNGPLDLLVEMIKDKQMDIFDIDLSELATEYVKLISTLKETDIDLASEYLVMAATLIQLKTKKLLEDPNKKQEVKEEEENLLKQIIEHQQFKAIAIDLREKEKNRKGFFIKGTDNYDNYQIEQDETQLDGNSDAVKLIFQMRKMFERINANKLREATIENFNLSPEERRVEIIEMIKNIEKISFEQVFSVPTINHFVVTMLTILDMSRKQELILKQNNQFDTIEIIKGVISE